MWLLMWYFLWPLRSFADIWTLPLFLQDHPGSRCNSLDIVSMVRNPRLIELTRARSHYWCSDMFRLPMRNSRALVSLTRGIALQR
jgi:hypothetical protein